MSDAQQPAFPLSRRAMLRGGVAAASAGIIPAAQGATSNAKAPRLIGIDRLAQGVRIRFDTQVVTISVPATGVASVVKQPAPASADAGGFFATPDVPTAQSCRFAAFGDRLRMTGDGIIVDIDSKSGSATFLTPKGETLIAEAAPAAPIAGVPIAYVQSFAIAAGLALHGLGQFREPDFDYAGKQIFLAHANSDAINAFLVTNGGWGLLWDTGTAAYFDAADARISFHAIAGDVTRYHVMAGASIDAQISGFRRLTGRAALLGKWAYGFWQSKERYGTQAELTEAVDIFRAKKLPLDVIVLDWRYWGENDQFSGMTFDTKNFPRPAAMMDHVHKANAHIVASIWPAFGPGTAIYKELEAAGRLLPDSHWSGGRVFDVTAPDSRAIYWSHIDKGLMKVGLDGLWTDGCEPEFMSTGNRYVTTRSFAANGSLSVGPIMRHLLTFSYYQSKGLSERMRAEYPERRPCILTRSSHPGQQAFGAITWSGDIFASWQTLRNQVVAGMNMALSGNPYWTCDIGGFLTSHRYPGGLADPAYKELYTRWFQFGTFLPIFRAHGTEVQREPWKFGAPGDPFYDAQVAALHLRYRLMPYIYSVAAQVALKDGSFIRPLIMYYPRDQIARGQTAQYMFGPSLLARVVDRPLYHATENIHEFLPNNAVQSAHAPAARVRFYEGSNFEMLVSDSLVDDLKLSWFGDLPRALRGKPYSARWDGQIVAQESGLHRFVVTSRGAVRFTLGGTVQVDGNSKTSAADGATGAISAVANKDDTSYQFDMLLEAGNRYPFLLEQRQATPDAVSMWVEWVTPSQRALATLPERNAVDVYLPGDDDWYDLNDWTRHKGGRSISADAPLSHMPVYVRAGSIIPMTLGIEYASQPVSKIELHLFAGADGAFDLYADAQDGQGYQQGEYAMVPMHWDDKRQALSLGARKGQFPGMESALAFTIFLHDGGNAIHKKEIFYDGKEMTLFLPLSP